MTSLITKIKRDLPLRISLTIVLAMSLLLTVTLLVMLRYSRQSMKEDTMNMASITLDRASSNIDNILLSVEETIGNTYFNMRYDSPDLLQTYAHKIVENNPYVYGCAIAFKDNIAKRDKEETWNGGAVSSFVLKNVKIGVYTTDANIIV